MFLGCKSAQLLPLPLQRILLDVPKLASHDAVAQVPYVELDGSKSQDAIFLLVIWGMAQLFEEAQG